MKMIDPAPYSHRIFAFFTDGAFLVLVRYFMIAQANYFDTGNFNLQRLTDVPGSYASGVNISFGLIALLYFPLFTIFFGATPGKMLMGLRVDALPSDAMIDSEPLTPAWIFLRETLGKVIGSLLLGGAWIFFNHRKRAAWDFFAKSYVVQTDEPPNAHFWIALLIIISPIAFVAAVPHTGSHLGQESVSSESEVAEIGTSQTVSVTFHQEELPSDKEFAKELATSKLVEKREGEVLIGYLVQSVKLKGSLALAGIQTGDILCGLNGNIDRMLSEDELKNSVLEMINGQTVELCVIRQGKKLRIEYSISESSSDL